MKITFDERLACVVGVDAAIVADMLEREKAIAFSFASSCTRIKIDGNAFAHAFPFWKRNDVFDALDVLIETKIADVTKLDNGDFSFSFTEMYTRFYK